MPAKFTDEADALAQIEALTTQVTKLTADNSASVATIAAITGERDKAVTDLAAAKASLASTGAERDAFKAANATLAADNAKLTAGQADFTGKVAAELAKAGVRQTAVETGAGKASGDKLTATDRLLAARGVKSVDQLSTKAK